MSKPLSDTQTAQSAEDKESRRRYMRDAFLTPLQSIQGNAELILMEPNVEEDVHLARAILLAAKRLQENLSEILDV